MAILQLRLDAMAVSGAAEAREEVGFPARLCRPEEETARMAILRRWLVAMVVSEAAEVRNDDVALGVRDSRSG